MNSDTLRLILEKNPGLFNILLTGVLLPLGVLWMTNRYNRKQRETEKSRDVKYNSKVNLSIQERIVYASLSKILFDVQQLYVSVTGTSISGESIGNAMKNFDGSVVKYQSDISNNMLYLSSPVINLIYKFYRQLGELKIELKKLSNLKEFDMIPLSLFYFSQVLADTTIEVQALFMKERPDLKVEFDHAHQDMMRNICGSAPSEVLAMKYEKIKQGMVSN